jgi:glycerate kinase
MRLLFAPDSFSGFDSAPALIARAQRILADRDLELFGLPMADGGEGTTLALMNQLHGVPSGHQVCGPLGNPINVPVLSLEGGHFVESARAVGRNLLQGPLQPWKASSFGLGQVLRAMDMNHEEGPLLVGLGGSACFDGGLGLAQGLGLQVLDKSGQRMDLGAGAAQLCEADKLVGPSPLEDRIVCGWWDVATSLANAPRLFATDKGFTKTDLNHLGDGLENWARVVNAWRGDLNLPAVELDATGTGAAGGIGFALKALLDAPLLPGARSLAHRLGLRAALNQCDAVLTGEGRMDASTLEGKVVSTVIQMARAAGVASVGCITGQVRGPMALPPTGPDWIVSCSESDEDDRDLAFEKALHTVADRLLAG